MTLGAVVEITVRNPAMLEIPVIHQIATGAMKERFRLDLRPAPRYASSWRCGRGETGRRTRLKKCYFYQVRKILQVRRE